ncbi:MAG: hypothetical protein MSC31_12450 [Solirubrobacteraceae bacterium MAG38_C4-C5]|nr:hypothetical protein [Candidatus Siliceabacter maunaloa]
MVSGETITRRVYGARRTPTRGFGAPFAIDTSERARVPTDVEFDDQRNAIVGYQIRVPGEDRLQSRTVRPSGARTDARTIAEIGFPPRFVATPAGRFRSQPVLAWLIGEADGLAVGLSRAIDGLLGEAVREDFPDDEDYGLDGIRFAATGDDTLLAVYNDGGLFINERPPSGLFGPTQRVSMSNSSAIDPRVAVGEDGRVALAWTEFVDGGGRAAFASVRTAGGQFGAPVQVSAPGENPLDLDVVVTSEGVVRVAYLAAQPELSTGPVRLVTLGGPTETLTAAGTDAMDLELAADGRGGTTVAWLRGNPGGDNLRNAIFARAITPSGRVGERRQLTPPGEKGDDLTLAVGADGSALAAWTTGEDQFGGQDLFGSQFRAVRRSATGG